MMRPPSFTIDADFSGGNIVVEEISSGGARLKPDLRDTTTPWFYWYFAVRNAAGRKLEFAFEPQYIGVLGPAISLDCGRSWRWMGADAVCEGRFAYKFPEGAQEVRFSVGMPYVREDWDRFLGRHRCNPFLKADTLVPAHEGRVEVPLLLMEREPGRAVFCVAVTARHHACEMMPSYVLEGLVEAVLAGDRRGEWLRENVAFAVVPFMDAQGVERGDQGKNRTPHDHNRDYTDAPIYPEIQAWKKYLPAWSRGRPLLAIDLHDPALCGPYHESIFFLEPDCRPQADRLDRLIEVLRRVGKGPLRVGAPPKLAFGRGFNTTPRAVSRAAATWMGSLPGALLGVSLETAYANASGTEVNAETARAFGGDLAPALGEWLCHVR